VHQVNIIDGADDRDSILAIGPSLGLTDGEIARIRHVSGHVGCFLPSPSVGSGTLFLTNNQIITAAHILFERSGKARSKCFFRNQDPEPLTIDLLLGKDDMRVGACPRGPAPTAITQSSAWPNRCPMRNRFQSMPSARSPMATASS
jgi:hypothetical protein